MGELELPMALTHRFIFVKDEATAEALDEAAGDEFEEDFLAASKEFDLHNLIEEELILAMPFIPMHEICPEEVPLQSTDADFRAVLSAKPNAFAVLGSFIAGPKSLAHFAGESRANTDDRPVVAYGAPRITYAPDSLPRDRLIELLQELAIQPADLLDPEPDTAVQRRMAAYWAARTRYIEIGRDIRPSADVRRMLTQVRDPLLSVLRISPDFRPAYEPLLQMATALGRIDAPPARLLLKELSRLQPARPEAEQALGELN